jgi:uracil-DNA glycosylase family 4
MSRQETLEKVRKEVFDCKRCLLRDSANQTVLGEGPLGAPIFVIGEAPGADEDEQGRPFVGRAGKVLNDALQSAGIERESIYVDNVLSCRPPENSFPEDPSAIHSCLPYLNTSLGAVLPEVAVVLGANAHKSIFEGRGPIKVGEKRGTVYMYQFFSDGHPFAIPVILTFHPSYVARRGGTGTREYRQLVEDLQFAASFQANNQQIPEIFCGVVNSLSGAVQAVTLEALKRAPDTFSKAPASSSGRHHPDWANLESGLLSHSLGVSYIAGEIAAEMGEQGFVPILRAAGLLHDLIKWGYGSRGDRKDYKHHEAISSGFVGAIAERMGVYEDLDVLRLLCAMGTHAGQWGDNQPRVWYELALHLADLLMSNKSMPDPVHISIATQDAEELLAGFSRLIDYSHVRRSGSVLDAARKVVSGLKPGFARSLLRR